MKFHSRIFSLLLAGVCLSAVFSFPVEARRQTQAEQEAAALAEQERQAAYNKTIESNGWENWPTGPQVYAESAIVMEANTGAILYAKDIDAQNYPASITKIMTALVTLEHAALDETVTYSYYATHSIEAGSSSIGRTEGEEMTVEESLYALMLESANECGNALAEHVAGSIDAFVDLMNEKAAALGCTNTHFANPHGLHNAEHYTSAHDMALIMQAALQNDDFRRISGTSTYKLRATNKHDTEVNMVNHHYMIAPYRSVSTYLDDTVIAGKTGYTSDALQTLVTAAERNGMTLICVTMRTRPSASGETGVPLFTDTAALLDYGTDHFTAYNIAQNETRFSIDDSDFFHTGSKIFGQNEALISLNPSGIVVLPETAAFADASPKLTFTENGTNREIATLTYTYQDQQVGSTTIDLADTENTGFPFDSEVTDDSGSEKLPEKKNFININLRMIFTALLILAVLAALVFFGLGLYKRHRPGPGSKRRRPPRRRRKAQLPVRDRLPRRPRRRRGRYR